MIWEAGHNYKMFALEMYKKDVHSRVCGIDLHP